MLPQLSYVQWVEVAVIAGILVFGAYVAFALDLFRKGK